MYLFIQLPSLLFQRYVVDSKTQKAALNPTVDPGPKPQPGIGAAHELSLSTGEPKALNWSGPRQDHTTSQVYSVSFSA